MGEAPRPAAADPRTYTPKHLAEKILTTRTALEGERKQVTVLFADVKGSMDLAEQVDPEEWHQILDRFFAILAEGVHRFEGTVNQYTGDGIMALFGAPIAHEDHAQPACYRPQEAGSQEPVVEALVGRQHCRPVAATSCVIPKVRRPNGVVQRNISRIRKLDMGHGHQRHQDIREGLHRVTLPPQRRRKAGFRFSLNARGPSFASSL